MPIFKCFRVLIFRNGMSPWHPGEIHIKSQLALKFGQNPKVCNRESQCSGQLMFWFKLILTTANGPETECHDG